MTSLQTIIDGFTKAQGEISDFSVAKFFWVILLTVVYGIAFRVVYFYYYRKNEPVDGSIARSFALLAPAVTTIFWLIQYSLPLSLGLLGALSFVRFRTPVKRAEDIAFILVLIAGSLAISVGKIGSALVLLFAVFIYSFIRHRFPAISGENSRFAVITFHTGSSTDPGPVAVRLREKLSSVSLVNASTFDKTTSMVFNAPGITETSQKDILDTLQSIDKNARVDVFFPDSGLGV